MRETAGEANGGVRSRPEGGPVAHDVFISYSSKDKVIADAVCASLEADHIRCYIAPRDVVPGQRYAQALVDAIHNTKVFVLVFSAASNASNQVEHEVDLAVSCGLPVLPLRVEDVMPCDSLEYYLAGRHWLDALTPPLEDHLARLSEAITVLLQPAAKGARSPFKDEWRGAKSDVVPPPVAPLPVADKPPVAVPFPVVPSPVQKGPARAAGPSVVPQPVAGEPPRVAKPPVVPPPAVRPPVVPPPVAKPPVAPPPVQKEPGPAAKTPVAPPPVPKESVPAAKAPVVPPVSEKRRAPAAPSAAPKPAAVAASPVAPVSAPAASQKAVAAAARPVRPGRRPALIAGAVVGVAWIGVLLAIDLLLR